MPPTRCPALFLFILAVSTLVVPLSFYFRRTQTTTMSQYKSSKPTIYLFGDSLTEWAFDAEDRGFGWALEQYYEGKVDIINRGKAAETSTSLRKYFTAKIINDISASPPLLITIFLGANDACFHHRHVHLPQFEANLRHYTDTIGLSNSTKGTRVLLITPPPINVPAPPSGKWDLHLLAEEDKAWFEQNTRDGLGHRTYLNKQLYAQKVMQIAKDYEGKTKLVAGLDFWTAMVESVQPGAVAAVEAGTANAVLPGSGLLGAKDFGTDVLTDGLHFGPTGYDLLSKELISLIKTKWPELRKEVILAD